MEIMGLTTREMTVLNGGGHSIGKTHCGTTGFEGPWTHNPTKFSNDFFKLLLSETWIPVTAKCTGGKGKKQFTDKATKSLMMLDTDLQFVKSNIFKKDVEYYAAN